MKLAITGLFVVSFILGIIATALILNFRVNHKIAIQMEEIVQFTRQLDITLEE